MPYGVYTVHQTSGWEGRELMKDFDVFIAQNGQTYRYLINNANFESYIKVVKVDAESGRPFLMPEQAFRFMIRQEILLRYPLPIQLRQQSTPFTPMQTAVL